MGAVEQALEHAVQLPEYEEAPLEEVFIDPQEGPQTAFFESEADIAIYGGAAFSGKTFALCLEPLRHLDVPAFTAVFFRRTTPEITNPGGLWDEAIGLYPQFGLEGVKGLLEFRLGIRTFIKLSHLQLEDTVYDWDGSQVPLFCFDQLEHFTRFQFFYMLSRNRSMCGVTPYIRATCNPNADSWLAEFLAWWIDQETGYPIPEHAGKLRWFTRIDDNIVWADTRDEIVDKYGEDTKPRSVTFIPGNIYDNKIGMQRDPNYIGNLKAMQRVERERLLGGNWKIKPAAGLMFRREWCPTIEVAPTDVDWVRYWDLAATIKTENNDPDWTVGIKMGRVRSTGRWILADARRMRETPGKVRLAIDNTAKADGQAVKVGYPQDPGQAGKDQSQQLTKELAGFMARSERETGDKIVRFSPFSAQCEAGNVDIMRGFSEETLVQLEGFPDVAHDDDADACSGAFKMFFSSVNLALWQRLAHGNR